MTVVASEGDTHYIQKNKGMNGSRLFVYKYTNQNTKA